VIGVLSHSTLNFPPIALSIFAHVSRSVTVRLKTSFSGVEEVGRQSRQLNSRIILRTVSISSGMSSRQMPKS